MSNWPLAQLSEIEDGAAKGIDSEDGRAGLILLRHGQTVRAFVNACPHQGTPLEIMPDRFLDATGRFLVCATHGARFRIEDGTCVAGPCLGASLVSVPIRVEGGQVLRA